MKTLELLAPARDLECGIAAINCGADAVYIGADRFGARGRAGNPPADIEALVRYAHKYWARVYVTLNTLLRDDELPEAVKLTHNLYDMGVDALIIQDVGLLECDLPPLPLIASTQMHNNTPAKVAFLEQMGFQRAILARELDLDQIRAIRQQTSLELEFFVHGALCVGYSGQCYLSYAIGGRSGNRGECAQPCRRRYHLMDGEDKLLVEDRYLLSLRDLNLSAYLSELMEAGISSFKIEGRLKDKSYVMNVVGHYRRELDKVLKDKRLSKGSSGKSQLDFTPDLNKTFNRGYTTYFIHGRSKPPAFIETPKMMGEFVGKVVSLRGQSFTLDTGISLHNGDGVCFFDDSQTLRGTVVNAVQGRTVTPNSMEGIKKGTLIYRNHDHLFIKQLEKSRSQRRIAVRLILGETPDGFSLCAVDEDGNSATALLAAEKIKAEKPESMSATLQKQLCKTGETDFLCSQVEIDWQEIWFMPLSVLNTLRRSVLENLAAAREQNRPVQKHTIPKNDVPYPEKHLDYRGNVLNRQADAFYRRHGVTEIDPAAESGLEMEGKKVMQTRYCLRHQLGLCRSKKGKTSPAEPLYLVDEMGHKYKLNFNCADCEMELFY